MCLSGVLEDWSWETLISVLLCSPNVIAVYTPLHGCTSWVYFLSILWGQNKWHFTCSTKTECCHHNADDKRITVLTEDEWKWCWLVAFYLNLLLKRVAGQLLTLFKELQSRHGGQTQFSVIKQTCPGEVLWSLSPSQLMLCIEWDHTHWLQKVFTPLHFFTFSTFSKCCAWTEFKIH